MPKNIAHKFQKTNLQCHDFTGATVKVILEDESSCTFNYAFYEEEGDFYAVYTEHCGYFAFYKESVTSITKQEFDE